MGMGLPRCLPLAAVGSLLFGCRATSWRKTRVRGVEPRPSGRLPGCGNRSRWTAPGCPPRTCKTASGQAKWLSRDPVEEKGGLNLYEFTLNNPINYIDTDGRFTGTKCSVCGEWYQGYHECKGPPTAPDPVGFALCMRNVNPVGLGEHLLLIGFRILHPQTPTDHAYLHYKHCDNCERVGLGIGGTKPGALPKPEQKFNPTDCKPCKRIDSKLQYGAIDKTGIKATDEEIWECISKVPTSQRYKPTGKGHYNCLDWAKEAASKCGLNCN